jgi:hypothetical protein
MAGTVFRDEAKRLDDRLLGGLSTQPSTHLAAPERTSADPAPLNHVESNRRDR